MAVFDVVSSLADGRFDCLSDQPLTFVEFPPSVTALFSSVAELVEVTVPTSVVSSKM